MGVWGGLSLQLDPFITRRLQLVPVSDGFEHIEGQIYYDTNEKTITLMTDVSGVSLQIGQESYIKVRNNSGGVIPNGVPCYITGGSGNLATVAAGKADAEETSEIIGISTHQIENNSNGYITAFGLVRDLNTNSFNAGDKLYLSPSVAGAITNVKPSDPNIIVAIGYCIYKHSSNGTILIKIHKAD